MDDTLQQETKELEYKSPNEEQGGIRRRLRDRDLLKKRKAEAEEKETNQEESVWKRSRAQQKSSSRKRGRPKKTEPTLETSVTQENKAEAGYDPAVVVIAEPADVIPVQISGDLTALESQSVQRTPAPLPALASEQSPVFASPLTSPAPVNPIPVLVSPSATTSFSAEVSAEAPVSAQDVSPAPAFSVFGLSKTNVPELDTASSSDPPKVETFFTESQRREAPDQILIEDVGPDEEEDIPPNQEKTADEEVIEIPLNDLQEQNRPLPVSSLSSLLQPQEYLPESGL